MLALKISNVKIIKTLGRIFLPPIRKFEIKIQLIDTYNKILTHRCLYMEEILEKLLLRTFNNVIELGQFICLSVRLFTIISEVYQRYNIFYRRITHSFLFFNYNT